MPTDSFRGTPTKTNQDLSTVNVLTNNFPTQQAAQLPNKAGDAEFQRQQSTVADDTRRMVQPGWNTLHVPKDDVESKKNCGGVGFGHAGTPTTPVLGWAPG